MDSPIYVRIDKRKVKAKMDAMGISTWNELGERTAPHGLSTRKMYDILDGYDWHTGQLYALCQVLQCKTTDLLSFDFEQVDPKVEAPNGDPRYGLKFSLVLQHPEFA